MLGVTAKNYPELVEEVLERGHDTASHGYAHQRVYLQTPDEFTVDIEQSVAVVKELTGRAPTGYRAPAFSLNRDTVWAYRILRELGFAWDSSQYDTPKIPRRLGPIPRSPYVLTLPGDGRLLELPVAVVPVARGRSLPLGGGTYWRVLPSGIVERALGKSGDTAALYFHPYEFDPSGCGRDCRTARPRSSAPAPRTGSSVRLPVGATSARACDGSRGSSDWRATSRRSIS